MIQEKERERKKQKMSINIDKVQELRTTETPKQEPVQKYDKLEDHDLSESLEKQC